jgi:dTDP-4-amino-4,6-dideoxygalactose transaminase
LIGRAEIIWDKGTNRSAFFRGEVDKYNWVDIGSSYLPSEVQAAYLYAQLEALEAIQQKRKAIWEQYYEHLRPLAQNGHISLPAATNASSNNYHLFYVLCKDAHERDQLIRYLKEHNIQAVFHYQPLHSSPYYATRHDGRALPNCDRFAATWIRLPFYNELSPSQVLTVCNSIKSFYAGM